MRLPQSFKSAVVNAARTLNHSFKQIGALHEGAIPAISERNAVLHLGASLLHAGFALSAEPAANSPSPALIASNQKITFAVAAHTFANLQPGKILRHAQALELYTPRAFPRLDLPQAEAFWQNSERWAVVLVQSFAGEKFNELWLGQTAALDTFEQNLRAFPKLSNAGKEDLSELASFLRAREAYVGMEPICSELWRPGERLDLLWAAFPLQG